MANIKPLPNGQRAFDLFMFIQPHMSGHQEQSNPTQLILKAEQDSSFPPGNVTALSDWRHEGDRVWSRTFCGEFPKGQSIYDIRKVGIPQYLASPSIDVAALPLDGASERSKGGATPPRRQIKLAVFDMDSTLINQEVIDELARAIGKYDQVAEITERAMQGQLDFAGSLRERVKLLRGLRHDIWEQIKPRITFAEGARELCQELRKSKVKMAVLSGGFTPLAEWVKGELGLDVAHANFLDSGGADEEFPFPHLNGKLVEGKPIVTAERKEELLLDLVEEDGISLSEVLCVGDGANDLKMLNAVGEGGGVAVALRAKPKVQTAAPNKLNSLSMSDILYLLGYSHTEVEAAIGIA